jgi:copper transport protein
LIAARAIFAWPLLVCQLTIFGTAAFALAVAPEAVAACDGLAQRLRALWRTLALLDLALSPLAFMQMAAGMADMAWRETLAYLPQIVTETDGGRIWVWRIGAAVLLAALAWIPARPRLRMLALAAASAALLILTSLTGHAIDRGALAIAIYCVHQAAAGLWIGALAVMLLGTARNDGASRWVETVTPRVSSLAGWSVAALALTGAYTAYGSLGWSLDLLIHSLYGRTLLWKLATAAVVLALAGYNRFRLIPALGSESARAAIVRNVSAECVLLAAVLAWTALLANSPPPH